VSRRSKPQPPCPQCASLRAKAKAVRKAEQRLEAADPACHCHNYARSFCIAPASEAWWTPERIAEHEHAQEDLDKAREDFKTALAELAESVR